MNHNIVPILAILAMMLSICFNLWWLLKMGQKYPSMKEWAEIVRDVYVVFCLFLILLYGGLMISGTITWREIGTGGMVTILFYLVSLMVALAPVHRRAIQRRRG